jgi:purine nucleosidase
VLTTAYLGIPETFKVREWETELITTGRSQGRTLVRAGGRRITALDTVDTGRFYEYMLEQWAR